MGLEAVSRCVSLSLAPRPPRSPCPGRKVLKVKLQASQGYRSDNVRPSTHSASSGLLFFRKDRMPSAGKAGAGRQEAAGAQLQPGLWEGKPGILPSLCLGPTLPKASLI